MLAAAHVTFGEEAGRWETADHWGCGMSLPAVLSDCLGFDEHNPFLLQTDLFQFTVLAWSRQTGVLEESVVKRLASVAQADPSAALSAFTRARALREDLYRVISALPSGQAVPSSEFDSLNKQIRQLMSESELIPDETGFRLERNGAADALDQMLWSVLRSAVELLTSDRVSDIRQCEGENCSWLFLDSSRTRRKKWCDMQVCGNRAKARRHYKKKKAAQNA